MSAVKDTEMHDTARPVIKKVYCTICSRRGKEKEYHELKVENAIYTTRKTYRANLQCPVTGKTICTFLTKEEGSRLPIFDMRTIEPEVPNSYEANKQRILSKKRPKNWQDVPVAVHLGESEESDDPQ